MNVTALREAALWEAARRSARQAKPRAPSRPTARRRAAWPPDRDARVPGGRSAPALPLPTRFGVNNRRTRAAPSLCPQNLLALSGYADATARGAGLLYGGDGRQLGLQLLGAAVIAAWALAWMTALLLGMRWARLLRVGAADEMLGARRAPPRALCAPAPAVRAPPAP